MTATWPSVLSIVTGQSDKMSQTYLKETATCSETPLDRTMRRTGAITLSFITLATMTTITFGEEVKKEGQVTVTTTIRRDGEHCDTGATDKCEIGKPCFTNVEITGEPAKQLYLTLKERGVKIMECCGEYVGTEDDTIVCWGGSHDFRCTIGYSSVSNETTPPQSCQYE